MDNYQFVQDQLRKSPATLSDALYDKCYGELNTFMKKFPEGADGGDFEENCNVTHQLLIELYIRGRGTTGGLITSIHHSRFIFLGLKCLVGVGKIQGIINYLLEIGPDNWEEDDKEEYLAHKQSQIVS